MYRSVSDSLNAQFVPINMTNSIKLSKGLTT